MRLYISGGITGIPDFEAAFAAAEAQLRAVGHEPLNPAALQPAVEERAWVDYMRADLKLLVDCDAIALLPGWERSKGARLEVEVATALGMPVQPVAAWVAEAGPLLACPCGCGWKDDSGASDAAMRAAVECRHPRLRSVASGANFCPDCSHWMLSPDGAKGLRVRMPRPMYRIVEEGERVG